MSLAHSRFPAFLALAALTLTVAAPSTWAFGQKRAAPAPALKDPNNPMRGIDVSDDQIRDLLAGIEQQGVVGPDQINLDSLRHPGDKAAYDKAIDLIAARILSSVQDLAEMKREVVRYSVIVNQADLTEEKVATITQTSSQLSQTSYDRAIGDIAVSTQDEDVALQMCISEVCVIEISQAFEDLTRFAQSADQDLDFRKLNSDTRVFWNFQQPVLRVSFARTFKKLVPDNADHNLFKVAAAGIVTPLSVVGTSTVQLLQEAGSAIFNPRYRHISLDVNRVKIGFKNQFAIHKNLFQRHYADAASGARAANYHEPAPQAPSAPSGVSGGDQPGPNQSYQDAANNRAARSKLTAAEQAQVDADLTSLINGAWYGYYGPSFHWDATRTAQVESELQSGASPNIGLGAVTTLGSGDDNDRSALMDLFIRYGADPMSTYNNTTPFEFAALSGRANWMAKFSPGLDVTRRLSGNRTVLMVLASLGGNADLIKQLVGRGADVNAKDDSGQSVLFYARQQPENRAVLIAAGAQL